MLIVTEPEPLPVAKARSGDHGSWDTLFRRYQLPLYAYVVELVQNEQASLDIVQETFISAVRHIADLRDDEKFGSWLFGIAHQKCVQHWRRNHRTAAAFDELAETSVDDVELPFEMLIREEDEAELMRLVHQLPVAQRCVLLLHFLEDFSLEEVARITGVPIGTVKSRLHYAKLALKKVIGEKP